MARKTGRDQSVARISIIVEFTPKPGCYDAFNAHIRAHAAATLAEEPGCLAFDVMQPLNEDGSPDKTRIMLLEIYRDMDAVRTHRANPRMAPVGAVTATLIDGRRLVLCEMD
jgi:autoinducer 2-degrading protein